MDSYDATYLVGLPSRTLCSYTSYALSIFFLHLFDRARSSDPDTDLKPSKRLKFIQHQSFKKQEPSKDQYKAKHKELELSLH